MRTDRRLNALARGRLRAQRGVAQRCCVRAEREPRPCRAEPVQRLVAILGPVLG